MAGNETLQQGALGTWVRIHGERLPRQRGHRRGVPVRQRFAFYGRISTDGYQDPDSSHEWQKHAAVEFLADRGVIVAEYFDIGHSRLEEWPDRPQAAALLAAVADPHRGFEAIVVGEYERAFCGSQLLRLMPLLERHGVQLWLPELDGPFRTTDVEHRATIRALGAYSRREILRARFRTSSAMHAHARLQGRNLGGRPPYGYRLVDAGPHPNAVHAKWGRRLRQLNPDPQTAPTVRWIFAQRLTGRSVASIARELNDIGVPCPSSADPDRNQHRSGEAWTLRTVAAILANPRYTGRQVWNRQRTERETTANGMRSKRNWNPAEQWAVSAQPSHPALVSEQDFADAQAINAVPVPGQGSTRNYAFVGLLICTVCERRMDSHWVNNRPGYRCRHGHTSAKTSTRSQPRNLYLREDHAAERIRTILTEHELLRLTDTMPEDPRRLGTIARTRGFTFICGHRTLHLSIGDAECKSGAHQEVNAAHGG